MYFLTLLKSVLLWNMPNILELSGLFVCLRNWLSFSLRGGTQEIVGRKSWKNCLARGNQYLSWHYVHLFLCSYTTCKSSAVVCIECIEVFPILFLLLSVWNFFFTSNLYGKCASYLPIFFLIAKTLNLIIMGLYTVLYWNSIQPICYDTCFVNLAMVCHNTSVLWKSYK